MLLALLWEEERGSEERRGERMEREGQKQRETCLKQCGDVLNACISTQR